MSKKYTICVDFDGVIHQYTSPWVNARTIPDPPVEFAIDWLFEIIQKFEVCIFSTRNHQFLGKRAMRQWLKRYSGDLWYDSYLFRGVKNVTFPTKKPAALIYLDDRAVRFEGSNFPTMNQIHTARPWNKVKP